MIPFLDVQQINARFESEFRKAFNDFLGEGQCVLGKKLESFEKEFSIYCGTKYSLGVGNGLDAIQLILKGYLSLGKLKEGDEVLVPANTYIASVLAIINSGLKPVFIEPDIDTFNVSITHLEQCITDKTKAVLVVHLYGQLADMTAINALAKKHDFLVIEDAAQAHGAVSKNRSRAGNLSNAATFSFYPGKNLGALGDGGAVTTNDYELYEIIKKLRNYGTSKKYNHEVKGVNSRLDELQAAFLSIKLPQLDEDNKHRREIARYYIENIKNDKINLPKYGGGENHVFHLFVIRCEKRDELQDYLLKNNIQTVIHYPVPPHKQKALDEFANLKLPVTEQMHKEVLSLPISPIQTMEVTQKIVSILNKF